MTPNQKAFLDMLAVSEGTKNIGDDGYNVLVGSTKAHPLLFHDYTDHPRVYNAACNSTAAGRYQILARYFDAYKKLLNLSDFSPKSQDDYALHQITERHALTLIDNGDIPTAIEKCNTIWASLPGSPYGQQTQPLDYLLAAYSTAGGAIIA